MNGEEEIIEAIEINTRVLKLRSPYKLSFGTIEAIDSIQVNVILNNGQSRLAETVPLPGYSNETKDSILAAAEQMRREILKQNLSESRAYVKEKIPTHPFACSPFLTAIDLFSVSPSKAYDEIEFVVPASADDTQRIHEIVCAEANKARTVKVKLTGNIDTDISCIHEMEKFSEKNFFVRFDANKAYSLENAEKFYAALAQLKLRHNTHYVEQPLAESEWLGHQKLVQEFPEVKTMLDESVVTDEDLQKAISITIPFVKFKLFKQGGLRELQEQIDMAWENKVKIVLGNGVAGSISNDLENFMYSMNRNKMFGASEANGFLKIKN